MAHPILVHAAFDKQAKVWYIHQSTLKGLHVESESFEGLVQEIKYGVESLLDGKTQDMSICLV